MFRLACGLTMEHAFKKPVVEKPGYPDQGGTGFLFRGNHSIGEQQRRFYTTNTGGNHHGF